MGLLFSSHFSCFGGFFTAGFSFVEIYVSHLSTKFNLVARFESVSGAILNRNRKSKVMCLGGWTARNNWPLPWLKTELQLKISGFIIKPTYNEMINEKCQSSENSSSSSVQLQTKWIKQT